MFFFNLLGVENEQELKEECERFLRSKLNHDNAGHLLLLADLHGANRLREAAVEHIATNANKILEMPVFDEIMGNKKLTKEIIAAMAVKVIKQE